MGGFGVSSRCLCILRYLMCLAKGRLGGERNQIHDRLFCCLASSAEVLTHSLLPVHKHEQIGRKTATHTSHRESSQLWTKHTLSLLKRGSHRHTEMETTPGSGSNRPPPLRGMVCLFLLLRPIAFTIPCACVAVVVVAEVIYVFQCFITKQLERPRLIL